ncbi:50S ribosomal protein L28 [Lyngbya sp. PCC 8106]|nr:50S ribosomal protein L28 [Lyngbya sp. PCC 8106]
MKQPCQTWGDKGGLPKVRGGGRGAKCRMLKVELEMGINGSLLREMPQAERSGR